MIKSYSDRIPKMTLDLRKSLAVFFLLLGLLLTGYGLLFPGVRPQVDPGFNVNLIWGLSMDCFGILLLLFHGRR